MGRRFTSAVDDRIVVDTAGLSGLLFTHGTIAAVVYRVTDTADYETVVGFNDTDTFYVPNSADQLALWDGVNERTGPTLALASRVLVGFTKPTGTVTARFHMYVFGTNTWTHSNSSGTVENVPAVTSMVIGSSLAIGAEGLSSELWVLGIWHQLVMTDSEFERLARGNWPNYSPNFYEQFTGHREVGDMGATLGLYRSRQTSRTGTTRGVQPPPPGFRMSPLSRRR